MEIIFLALKVLLSTVVTILFTRNRGIPLMGLSMLREIIGSRESLIAVVANIGPLLSVSSYMSLQVL